MKLEQQVCSLELAKKLKALGVKQESLFYWSEHDKEGPCILFEPIAGRAEPYTAFWYLSYSAFTVAELGEMLPHTVRAFNPRTRSEDNYYLHYWSLPDGTGWYIEYHTPHRKTRFGSDATHCAHWEEADTEANARARLLIHLIENNLLPTNKQE